MRPTFWQLVLAAMIAYLMFWGYTHQDGCNSFSWHSGLDKRLDGSVGVCSKERK